MNADDPSATRAGADPAALRRIPFALFAFFAVPLLLAHSRRTEGQNGASRGAPAPAEFRVGCGAVPQGRAAGLGAGRDGKGRLAAADVFFCEIAQRPSRRVRRGRGHDPGEGSTQVAVGSVFAKLRNDPPAGSEGGGATTPGKDRHRSRWARFLRNCATTLPPEQAPAAGLAPAGCAAPGKGGRRSGGRTFCEIAQRPSRRGRRLPLGSHRPGALHRGRTGVGRGGRGFCEIAQRPSRRGRRLPLGSLWAGALHRGRTGAGRGGRDFCEIAQRPSRRGRRLPLGSLWAGALHRGRTGAGRGGRDFCEMRNDPPCGAGASRWARSGRVRCIGEGRA